MSIKAINYGEKKYNILKMLHEMSVERYRYLMVEIPNKMSISDSLWRKWLYTDINDQYEIPYSQLMMLAQLLNTSTENLINYQIKKLNAL